MNHSLVNHMKWLPHARKMAMTEAATSHHLSRPLQSVRPRMKRNMVIAPIYIGPAVKGCGPQYRGICLSVWRRLGWPALLSSFAVSESISSAPDDAPPLKFGISRLGISLMPYDHAVA